MSLLSKTDSDNTRYLLRKENDDMIKKMNRLLVVFILLAVICSGCSSQHTENKGNKQMSKPVIEAKEPYDAYAEIKSKEVMAIPNIAEIDGDPSDTIDIYKRFPAVALVRIESIDGGDNINQTTNEYTYPFTYGKMKILAVYKGDLQVNATIGYTRMGGIIPFNKYYASLYPEQQSKIDRNMKDDKPEYVEMMFDGDIQIEAGKAYLVYLDPDNDYEIDGLPVYSIGGWEGGLREIQGNPKAKTGVKVHNNYTGEWDTLNEILP